MQESGKEHIKNTRHKEGVHQVVAKVFSFKKRAMILSLMLILIQYMQIAIFLQDTLIKMRKTKIWKLENDFYNFAAKHFASVKKVVTIDNMIQSSIQINNNKSSLRL